jgi:putative transposase
MPWKETCSMEERKRFVIEAMRSEESFSEICRRYGVSRRVGYKWLARFESDGARGLADRSRARRSQAHATCESVAREIVALRKKRPRWGPKKLRALLVEAQPDARWPAVSTIAGILSNHGLVVARRPRLHVPAMESDLAACAEANDVWGIDFKGWFRTGDGRRCEPLSLSDLATRYVLRLQAVPRTSFASVWPLLDAAFREFGLPRTIRSDNGPPFASAAPAGLSRFAVQLIKAGVVPERIRPGRPQQNGRHERLHLTLKLDTAAPPAASLRAQQRRFDDFVRVFNHERPHEALGQTKPAAHYRPSARIYTGRLRSPEYARADDVRYIHRKGELRWRGHSIFISEALAGEPVAITRIDERRWRVDYATLELGTLDDKATFTARRPKPSRKAAPQPNPPG